MPDLERFKAAQETDFEYAMEELRSGRKRGHWIWYIFPQLEGLGMSETARYYGIHGQEEAVEYLDDPVLRSRLLEAAGIVASQRSIPLTTLMGSSIDALKLVSSMTLFAEVARQVRDIELADQAALVLTAAAEQGYPPCNFTLAQLGSSTSDQRQATTDSYHAVIFDMDGVLVDSEPAFHQALNEVLAPTGKQIEWERYQSFLGTSTTATWRGVMDALGLELDAREYVERYNEALIDVLARPKPLLPGVAVLIERLRAQGTPIAVATSSLQAWVEAVFRGASLPLETFDALAWRELVARSKPAPDLYLKAAELIGVPPERCVAIEDTPPGVASAKAAGMYAVQVRSASSALPPIDQADLVLESLEAWPAGLVGGR